MDRQDDAIVEMEVAIENVGPSTIDILPLEIECDPCRFFSVSAGPMSEESLDDSLVNWYHLATVRPNDFGVNSAHGEVSALPTVFMIMHEYNSTTDLAIVNDDDAHAAPHRSADCPWMKN